MSPSTPNDAYWMIQEAIASKDPVVFLEPKSRYWPKGQVDLVDGHVPMHTTRVARTGTEVTLVGHGAMVATLMQAAEIAESEGTSCEVVDLRSISPIDWEPLLASVAKTGRLVIAQEASGFVSVGSEIAATVAERAFYTLQAPRSGVRLRRAVPGVEARAPAPPGRRPRPRGRRPRSRVLTPVRPRTTSKEP